MNQPAKAQEPSMEEILASIRRIISDDEAKPAAAAAPVKQEAKPAVAKTEPPRPAPVAEPKPAAPKPAAAAPAKAPEPAPKPAPAQAEKNSQAEIDAMMASFDAPEAAASEPASEAEEADNDVFELTEQMAMPELPSVAFQKVEPEDDLEFAESGSAPSSHATRITPPSHGQTSARAGPVDMPSMLSSTAAASVESAFNALASTVLSNNARTLEALVKEMLRPMLKSWLDDNLPSLVERIVRAEIERVSRGR